MKLKKLFWVLLFAFSYSGVTAYQSNPSREELNEWVENYTRRAGIKVDKRRNILLKGNVIHVFLDQNGGFIKSSLPTTAKQRNTYQFHILYWDTGHQFRLKANGFFKPVRNILDTSIENMDMSISRESEAPIEIKKWTFGVVGPFTDELKIVISKLIEDDPTEIVNATISIAKLYNVSLATSLLRTTLRNPQNIEEFNNGTITTLIADDPATRGALSVMATYYPYGRSFLFPPKGGLFSRERLGIVVGTQLNDKLDENFFLGGAWDFATGGSFTLGMHWGRRNYVVGHRDDPFDFGEEEFTGNLAIRKAWDVGVFFGVIIDTRVAIKLISALGGGD